MLRGQPGFPVPSGYSSQYQGYILGQSAVAVSVPADTTEDTLATISVPANAMGANGLLRILIQYTMNSNANTKSTRIRFSGGAGTQFLNIAPTSSVGGIGICTISNRGAANSQVGSSFVLTSTGSVILTSPTTAAVDTIPATTIVITGQKAVAGDTLTLESYLVELLYGA